MQKPLFQELDLVAAIENRERIHHAHDPDDRKHSAMSNLSRSEYEQSASRAHSSSISPYKVSSQPYNRRAVPTSAPKMDGFSTSVGQYFQPRKYDANRSPVHEQENLSSSPELIAGPSSSILKKPSYPGNET
jgi:hypothetical protein